MAKIEQLQLFSCITIFVILTWRFPISVKTCQHQLELQSVHGSIIQTTLSSVDILEQGELVTKEYQTSVGVRCNLSLPWHEHRIQMNLLMKAINDTENRCWRNEYFTDIWLYNSSPMDEDERHVIDAMWIKLIYMIVMYVGSLLVCLIFILS